MKLRVGLALFFGLGLAALIERPPFLALLPPLSALLLILSLTAAFPGFLGPRLRTGHAFVLPLAFLALTLGIGSLWDYREIALVVQRPKMAAIQAWLSPGPLLSTFVLQSVGLLLATCASKG